MNSRDLKDREARKAIIEDLDTCILVEAGAGSGKTHSLVERMVALVAGGKCTADRLAAVTFTRKAASELKGRFQLALEKAFASEQDPGKRKNLGRALDDLDRCFLGTIHSFCAAILRERPVEAGLDPEFEELDELEDALIREKAWEDYLAQVQVEAPGILDGLLQIDVEAQDLKDCYAALSTYPEVEIAGGDAPRPSLGEMRAELYKLLELAEEKLPSTVPAKGWDGLQKLLRKALGRRRVFNLDDDLALLRLLAALDREGAITQNRWLNKDDAKFMKSTFDGFRKNHILPALKAWREYRHSRVFDFVKPAVELYAGRRAEQSKLNFQDLLMITAGLLRENTEVRRYFQERFTHVLVDEFQDTDPIQAEIMFYLTGRDGDERNWRRIVPRPGALFVVGDPKQAIYRFRRADIDTYNEVKRLIAGGGGRVLNLTVNFRSVREIGDLVNPVFSTLLPGEATSYQATFTSLDTVRESEEGTASGARVITIPKVDWHKQQEIAEIDAARIASWIRRALDGGISLSRTEGEREAGLTESPRPCDFMILLRYKSNMDIYARALEKQGIPFHIAGGGGFSGSPDLAGVMKVLKAVMDPDDPVRLAAALRGSLFGLSDGLLWRFKKAGGRFNYNAPVPEDLDPGDRDVFLWAFELFKKFRDMTVKLPASAALENIVTELGVIPYTLTGELGKSRSGHIVQCMEFVAAAERRGITSFSSILEYLDLLLEAGVEEEINIAPREDDAVRLMNLHKAKGLEAPVVFLANPGKNASHPPDRHISRVGDNPRGYFVVKKESGYTTEIIGQPPGWDKYSEEEMRYLSAEETRLLYVAATRARNLLVVSTYSGKPELSPWSPLHGLLNGVPELEDNKIDRKEAAGIEGAALSREELEKAREGFVTMTAAANTPSYSVESVTSLVKGAGDGPERKSTGRGQSWGRVVHRVLEAYAKKAPPNLELFVDNVITVEGRAPEERDQVINLVNQIIKSDLWQRMLKSRRRFMEAPFSAMDDSPENGRERIISGVIDLVFQEEDGWVIVDYKTDTVKGEEQLRELARCYSPQVEMYKRFWEKISGERVKEAGLYFTHLNRWVTV
ncbi:MAG: UvrD-helicase domain-containing protein [Bacillota bacterium]